MNLITLKELLTNNTVQIWNLTDSEVVLPENRRSLQFSYYSAILHSEYEFFQRENKLDEDGFFYRSDEILELKSGFGDRLQRKLRKELISSEEFTIKKKRVPRSNYKNINHYKELESSVEIAAKASNRFFLIKPSIVHKEGFNVAVILRYQYDRFVDLQERARNREFLDLGWFQSSLDYIQQHIGLSKKQVKLALKKLESLGLMEIDQKKSGKPNYFRFTDKVISFIQECDDEYKLKENNFNKSEDNVINLFPQQLNANIVDDTIKVIKFINSSEAYSDFLCKILLYSFNSGDFSDSSGVPESFFMQKPKLYRVK